MTPNISKPKFGAILKLVLIALKCTQLIQEHRNSMRMWPAALGWIFLISFTCIHAHIGRGLSLGNTSLSVISQNKRAHFANESQLANVTSFKKQCRVEDLPVSAKLRKAYPKDNKIASIQDHDEDAKELWAKIKSSNTIPSNVEQKQGVKHHMAISKHESHQYSDSADPDCWWSATMCTKPKINMTEDITFCPEPQTWGLTFDDGPDCGHNEFYDFLQSKNLRATMFYIGSNVLNYPLQAQRAITDGHEVCVHTWSHHYMTTLDDEQVFAELYYTTRILKDVLGVTVRCWRPPFGDVDDRVRAIADQLGLRTIIWSRDTDDWNVEPDGDASKEKINSNYESIINKDANSNSSSSGNIVLTHELSRATMHEFMRMYPKIESAFEHIVPVHVCMNNSHPYIENAPTYPSFQEFTSGDIIARNIPNMDNYSIQVASKLRITPLEEQNHTNNSSDSAQHTSDPSSDPSSSTHVSAFSPHLSIALTFLTIMAIWHI